MAPAGKSIIVPTFENIVELNKNLITRYGGYFNDPHNLRSPGSLEWLIGALQALILNQEMYPTIAQKAAIIAWTIITGHVFWDGCKRTGMFTAIRFLTANGYFFDASSEEVIQVAISIAERHSTTTTYEMIVDWFEENIRKFEL